MSENKQLNFDIEKYRQARWAEYMYETGGRPPPLDGDFRRSVCYDITKLAIVIFLLLLWLILTYIGAQKKYI